MVSHILVLFDGMPFELLFSHILSTLHQIMLLISLLSGTKHNITLAVSDFIILLFGDYPEKSVCVVQCSLLQFYGQFHCYGDKKR